MELIIKKKKKKKLVQRVEGVKSNFFLSRDLTFQANQNIRINRTTKVSLLDKRLDFKKPSSAKFVIEKWKVE